MATERGGLMAEEAENVRNDIARSVLAALRSVCLALPDVVEESAWVGVRWRVRTKTFAHVLVVEESWPPAYARAARLEGPATLLMFRSTDAELGVLKAAGAPFFDPPWRADEIGLVLAAEPDWTEIGELITESYCAVAPASLVARVDRPPP